MALKNTFAKKGAGYYIDLAQTALIKAGASGIQYAFEDGRIIALKFLLPLNGKEIGFSLPVNWRKFQNVLKKEQNRRWDEDDYCYKVAWACMKDWIEAQMAFVESENVTIPQVFLPYAVSPAGETLFEYVSKNPSFLLGDGK